MEFTDVFIAIARAAGIPARESVGYAYTSNGRLRPLSFVADVLHAWPEYYDTDQHVWVPIDPTWASTTGGVNYFDKLDFNHIVFAHYGVTSDYPYPAGFYRKNGKTTKDVTVTFATSKFIQPTSNLATTISFPTLVTAGITARGSVTVENSVGAAIPAATMLIQSSPIDIAFTRTETDIPPFARFTYPVTMKIPNYFMNGNGRILTSVNGQTQQFMFKIQPITSFFLIPTLCFSGILIILLVLATRKLHLWKRQKKQ